VPRPSTSSRRRACAGTYARRGRAYGLEQISGRSNLGFDDLVRLDFFYLENWSIWLDISILGKTIPAVLSGRVAY
jgi:lipopolysaccharide/colanic/teichoic acid biosynthesis glycosyltransferase